MASQQKLMAFFFPIQKNICFFQIKRQQPTGSLIATFGSFFLGANYGVALDTTTQKKQGAQKVGLQNFGLRTFR